MLGRVLGLGGGVVQPPVSDRAAGSGEVVTPLARSRHAVAIERTPDLPPRAEIEGSEWAEVSPAQPASIRRPGERQVGARKVGDGCRVRSVVRALRGEL